MKKISTMILIPLALALGIAVGVFATGGESRSPRTFESTAQLKNGALVKLTAEVSSPAMAAEMFPNALWWGDDLGIEKSHLSALSIDVGGKKSWVRLSAYADLTDVKSVELKKEQDGFRIVIEGGEQATRYVANVHFDNDGFLVRRRVEGSSFPTEVWEETTYSFIRRGGM